MKNKLIFYRNSYNWVNIILTMKLRERGITVGDLLIILIIIFSTIFIVNKYKDQKENSLHNMKTEIISLKN